MSGLLGAARLVYTKKSTTRCILTILRTKYENALLAFINDEAAAPRDKEQFFHNLWKNLSFVGVEVEKPLGQIIFYMAAAASSGWLGLGGDSKLTFSNLSSSTSQQSQRECG